jgi:hypothetical protein
MDWSNIATVVQLAVQFGPFLFAILFILVVTRTAQGYYNEANTRTNPPASTQEVQTYKFYFMCSIWCGIVVMTLSIAWWIYAQSRGSYVYQLAIVNLTPDEIVTADYYEQTHPHPVVVGAINLHDVYFIIVQERPFNVGDKFDFAFYQIPQVGAGLGAGVAGVPIQVTYAGRKQERYKLQIDGNGHVQLALAEEASPENSFADDFERLGVKVARIISPQAQSARRGTQ